tara:strand:+ start:9151 stop:10809 length:1659 start_codon:yes stop_codon:yes gene_type:complete
VDKLGNLLKRIGAPRLVGLYGEGNVNSIANILQDSINEVKLVELLRIKFGKQILANKAIRIAVLTQLSHDELGYILDGENSKGRKLDRGQLEKIAKLSWGRTKATSKRMLHVLDLDDDYLPDLYTPPPLHEIVTPDVFLYPHQKRLKDKFIRHLNSGVSRLVVHMPTGAGKTRTSIEGVVDYWKANADREKYIVWLAHSEELCEQAFETFSKIWKVRGESEINMYRLWGNRDIPDFRRGNGIVIAGFQKLYSLLSSESNEVFIAANSLKNNTAIIIVDEAHKAVAPTYRTCIEYLFSRDKTKLIGLTATPGRGTNDIDEGEIEGSETQMLASMFDNNKIGITSESGDEIENPIKYLQELGFISKIKRKKVTTSIELELTEKEKRFVADFLELPTSILKKLADSDERNAIILGEIAALIEREKQVIVFALSVSHAHLITELLNLKKIKARCVDGSMPTSERYSAISEYKSNEVRVLVNYGVLTTGFDAPNTNAVLISRPTASLVLYSQMIGRGIRGTKVGGNEFCDLVDLEDNLLGFPAEDQAFNHFNGAWSQ